MVWTSFKRLDETFGIESGGPDGCWIDKNHHHHTGFTPAWNKGIPHTQETKNRISQANTGRKLTQSHKDNIRRGQPKTKSGGKWCKEARNRRSEMQKGKKRGKYKTSGRQSHLRKPITIEGVEYPSISHASKSLGVSRKTIMVRYSSK